MLISQLFLQKIVALSTRAAYYLAAAILTGILLQIG